MRERERMEKSTTLHPVIPEAIATRMPPSCSASDVYFSVTGFSLPELFCTAKWISSVCQAQGIHAQARKSLLALNPFSFKNRP